MKRPKNTRHPKQQTKKPPKTGQRSNRARWLSRNAGWLRIAAVLGVLAALILVGVVSQRKTSSPPLPPHFPPEAWSTRTIVIAENGEQLPRKGTVLLTSLVAGTVPQGARQATVLTDSDCAPDQNGISHCLNELAIDSVKVMIRHHHAMQAIPCLRPGEVVNIIDGPTYKSLPASS